MEIAVRFEIVEGKIQLFDKDNIKLAGKDTKWEGDFYCSTNKLISLIGSPELIGRDFLNNQIKGDEDGE